MGLPDVNSLSDAPLELAPKYEVKGLGQGSGSMVR